MNQRITGPEKLEDTREAPETAEFDLGLATCTPNPRLRLGR